MPIPDLPAEIEIDGKPFPAPITVSPLVQAIRYGLVWCPTDDLERCVVRDPLAALGDAGQASRYEELIDTIRDWNAQLPTRDSNAWLASKGGTASDRWPRSFLWIAVAAVALAIRRPRGSAPVLVLMAVGGLVRGCTRSRRRRRASSRCRSCPSGSSPRSSGCSPHAASEGGSGPTITPCRGSS